MTRLLGTLPQQVPTNADLGTLALQDSDSVNITGGQSFLSSDTAANYFNDTQISNVKPSLNLDFCNNTRLDPRITYTRSSTGSYYDGKTFALAEQNLVPWSQQFDNAAWTKTGHSVVANATIAPDGTMTGYGYVAAAATSTDFRLSGLASSSGAGVYTASCYFKKGTAQYAYLALTDGGAADRWAAATVDMSGGTITQTVNGAGITAVSSTITSAANGWYRLTVTGTLAAASGIALRCVYSNSSTPSLGSNAAYSPAITTAGGEFFYLWGAQVEQRSAVSAYTPTTSAAITNYIPALQTAANNTPRFDYDPISGECKGFLIEEQRTNLALYSKLFNTGWSASKVTRNGNATVAPDGTLTASNIIEDTTFGLHQLYQTVSITSGTTYTFSVYAKAKEKTTLVVYNQAVSSTCANFNLLTGTVSQLTGSSTNTITPVGNGWYRCSVTVTSNITGTGYFNLTLNNSEQYIGDGWSGLYIWGAQLEQGSFATSYIPTDSAQVTRSRDIAYLYGSNMNWFNNYEGSIVTEANAIGTSDSNYWTLSDGTINNTFVAKPLSNLYKGSIGAYNNIIFQFTLPSFTFNAYHKTSFAYGVNNYGFSFDGSSASTAKGAVPSLNRFDIGFGAPGSSNPFDGWIKSIKYYPKRLSNAELQELTS